MPVKKKKKRVATLRGAPPTHPHTPPHTHIFSHKNTHTTQRAEHGQNYCQQSLGFWVNTPKLAPLCCLYFNRGGGKKRMRRWDGGNKKRSKQMGGWQRSRWGTGVRWWGETCWAVNTSGWVVCNDVISMHHSLPVLHAAVRTLVPPRFSVTSQLSFYLFFLSGLPSPLPASLWEL